MKTVRHRVVSLSMALPPPWHERAHTMANNVRRVPYDRIGRFARSCGGHITAPSGARAVFYFLYSLLITSMSHVDIDSVSAHELHAGRGRQRQANDSGMF